MKRINLSFSIILIVFSLICGINIKIEAEEKIDLNKYFDSTIENKSIYDSSKENEKEPKQQDQNVSEKEETSFNNSNTGFKWFAGVTQNTFDTTMTLHGLKWTKHKEELQRGVGFYGGVKYKFTDRVGINGGIEYIASEKDDLKVSLFAPYGEVTLGFFDDGLSTLFRPLFSRTLNTYIQQV
ncbi:hypothetical protein Halha_1483 [Halobacteroides halobius DSM 5150]|uniref:Uncharacterized protein n=1 Tax=Halobacteroides halobius (strain ATCC 35273 / DSM 5150 / MD-1) TaxID=748449 RepID=L0KA67_HALHC|nr:hypothetical protein [Halobacteroides halobius]AGB41425.1 hypothetical protein Halha_1483 [Halobacteroides halobius DSM 5150]